MSAKSHLTNQRAKALRHNETFTEKKLWKLLKDRKYKNMKFRRQYPIPPYIADFYCHQLRLVIELDGISHDNPAKKKYDAHRDELIRNKGIRVIRISDSDFIEKPSILFEEIDKIINED